MAFVTTGEQTMTGNDNQERVKRADSNFQNLPRTIRGIRITSKQVVCGRPLYDIAIGPDLAKGQIRGHARGVIAIGDIATGVVALGGVARGLIAFGGVALGGLTFGGVSVGLAAIGGAAIGVVALGGGAVGVIAAGGMAIGYFACGGNALGTYTISALTKDPVAVEFFKYFLPDSWFGGL